MLIWCGIYGGKLKVVGNSGGIVVGSGNGLVRYCGVFTMGWSIMRWLVGMG